MGVLNEFTRHHCTWIVRGGCVRFPLPIVLPDPEECPSQTVSSTELNYDYDTDEEQKAERLKSLNKEAESFYKKGKRYRNNEDLEKAYKYFNKAYLTCNYGYEHEDKLYKSRELVRKEIKAEKIKIAEANKDADDLNERGLDYLKKERFEKAARCFTAAWEDCSEGYKRKREFEKNMNKTKNKYSVQLNEDGLDQLRQGNLRDALRLFKQAYRTCVEGYAREEEFKENTMAAKKRIEQREKEKVQNEEAETFYQKGEKCMTNNEFQKARKLFKKARSTCTPSCSRAAWFLRRQSEAMKAIQIEEEKREAENLKKEKEKKRGEEKEIAAKKLKEAKKFWRAAWKAEEEGEEEEAERLFQKTVTILQQCVDLVDSSAEEFLQLVRLKVEGNKKFNEGVDLLETGNELKVQEFLKAAMKKYRRAQKKLQESIDKFSQGRKKGEKRFGKSREVVQEFLTSVEKVIECCDEVAREEELVEAVGNLKIRRRKVKKEKLPNQDVEKEGREEFNLIVDG